MTDKSIQEIISESFSVPDQEAWNKAAEKEIEGRNPWKTLAWNIEEHVPFKPYYDAHDTKSLSYSKAFEFSAAKTPSPRTWGNLPYITVTDPVKANTLALQYLNHGADGILFNLSEAGEGICHKLLHEVVWPYCQLSFQTTFAGCQYMAAFIREQRYASGSLSGGFYWTALPADLPALVQLFSVQPHIKTLGLIVQASSPIAELSRALVQGVELIEQLTAATLPLDRIIKQISFSVFTDTNVLVTIAKLRALRLLWYQVIKAYGVSPYTPDDLHLHVRSAPYENEHYAPHENLIKSIPSALAAVLGGCDSLTVFPQDEHNGMMNRIALNVTNILREESHLDKVADPVAGTYVIECMVHEMAEKAWKEFQQITSHQHNA